MVDEVVVAGRGVLEAGEDAGHLYLLGLFGGQAHRLQDLRRQQGQHDLARFAQVGADVHDHRHGAAVIHMRGDEGLALRVVADVIKYDLLLIGSGQIVLGQQKGIDDLVIFSDLKEARLKREVLEFVRPAVFGDGVTRSALLAIGQVYHVGLPDVAVRIEEGLHHEDARPVAVGRDAADAHEGRAFADVTPELCPLVGIRQFRAFDPLVDGLLGLGLRGGKREILIQEPVDVGLGRRKDFQCLKLSVGIDDADFADRFPAF